jgi:hypothetical protein
VTYLHASPPRNQTPASPSFLTQPIIPLTKHQTGPNRDLYTTTTLCICILTTCVCGGLTEPVLDKMGMKTRPQGRAATRSRAGSLELMADRVGLGVAHRFVWLFSQYLTHHPTPNKQT